MFLFAPPANAPTGAIQELNQQDTVLTRVETLGRVSEKQKKKLKAQLLFLSTCESTLPEFITWPT